MEEYLFGKFLVPRKRGKPLVCKKNGHCWDGLKKFKRDGHPHQTVFYNSD